MSRSGQVRRTQRYTLKVADNGPEFVDKAVRDSIYPTGQSLGERLPDSFNGKPKDELLNGEIFTTLQEAKVLTEVWGREYNQVRPHSSLGYKPPAPETVSGSISATAS